MLQNDFVMPLLELRLFFLQFGSNASIVFGAPNSYQFEINFGFRTSQSQFNITLIQISPFIEYVEVYLKCPDNNPMSNEYIIQDS